MVKILLPQLNSHRDKTVCFSMVFLSSDYGEWLIYHIMAIKELERFLCSNYAPSNAYCLETLSRGGLV